VESAANDIAARLKERFPRIWESDELFSLAIKTVSRRFAEEPAPDNYDPLDDISVYTEVFEEINRGF
jgi:hypothetical protein